MGKMKEPLTDHVQCRVEKTRSDRFCTGDFSLTRIFDGVYLRHVSGEGFGAGIVTFEAEVCPWEEWGSKDNVAELVEKFYVTHF